jgi:enterochelin esterase-like enzyme
MNSAALELEAIERLDAGLPGPLVTRVSEREIDVTLAYRPVAGDGPVLVVAPFAHGGLSERRLHAVPGRDVVARTWRVPSALLCTYLFWVGREGVELPEPDAELIPVMYSDAGAPRPDPTNPSRLTYPVDPERPAPPFVQSILRGPDAPVDESVDGVVGELSEHRFASEHLGDERRVWVHVAGDVEHDEPALMVVFDGGVYAHLLHTPEIVEALVARGELPPMVTLYPHFASDEARNRELMCRPGFASFVVDELVPWASGRWRVTSDPARSIVVGSSLGGLSAAYVALEHPERFGNVIAQSPSMWWHPDSPAAANWLTAEWSARGPIEAHVYVEMGELERGIGEDGRSGFDHTADFAAAAAERGSSVDFQTFCGGHDFVCWRATFPRALRSIGSRWH